MKFDIKWLLVGAAGLLAASGHDHIDLSAFTGTGCPEGTPIYSQRRDWHSQTDLPVYQGCLVGEGDGEENFFSPAEIPEDECGTLAVEVASNDDHPWHDGMRTADPMSILNDQVSESSAPTVELPPVSAETGKVRRWSSWAGSAAQLNTALFRSMVVDLMMSSHLQWMPSFFSRDPLSGNRLRVGKR